MADEKTPVPDVIGLVRARLFARFGFWGLATLPIAGVILSGIFYSWSQWDEVKKWPGVSVAIEYVTRDSIPKADPARFSVMVALLADDDAGEYAKLIAALLTEFDGIQTLQLDRTIKVQNPGEDASGHATAREYLQASGASILIWGRVLRHDGKSHPQLYITSANSWTASPKQYAVESAKEFKLPPELWRDLAQIIRLVVLSSTEQFINEDVFDADRLQNQIESVRTPLAASDNRSEWNADRLPDQIARVRKLLAASVNRPEWDVDARASIQLILGYALVILGEQTGQDAPLLQAVEAFNVALQEFSREREQLKWALTQNGLGSALWTLGRREGGTGRLEEAVTAYTAAIKEYTRDGVSLNWSMIQNNLGLALTTLGQRENSTARLEQAVTAFHVALEERTRARVPLLWAVTQYNLGNALSRLGEREGGTARLQEAVAAYHAAIEEATRDLAGLGWAAIHNNLGVALAELGKREHRAAYFEQAVKAYREALNVATREPFKQNWAGTQQNLGAALLSLGGAYETQGIRQNGTDSLQQAVKAYQEASEVFRIYGDTYGVIRSENRLTRVRALIRDRQSK